MTLLVRSNVISVNDYLHDFKITVGQSLAIPSLTLHIDHAYISSFGYKFQKSPKYYAPFDAEHKIESFSFEKSKKVAGNSYPNSHVCIWKPSPSQLTAPCISLPESTHLERRPLFHRLVLSGRIPSSNEDAVHVSYRAVVIVLSGPLQLYRVSLCC